MINAFKFVNIIEFSKFILIKSEKRFLSFKTVVFLSFIFVFFASLGLPTIYSDNAFYLTTFSIGKVLSQKDMSLIGGFTYAGSLEWLILHLVRFSSLKFIILYKFVAFGLNYLFFLMAANLTSRTKIYSLLEVAITFSALYFYLSPGYYSLVIAGFSCAYLASRADCFWASIGFWVLALGFCGIDLPNPKYIGLVFIVYIYSFLFRWIEESKKNIFYLSINISIFVLIVSALGFIYLNAKVSVPLGYYTSNKGIFLDLVGRSYLGALLPYKANRQAFYIYTLVIIYLHFFVFKALNYIKISPETNFTNFSAQRFKSRNILILGLLGLVYYFSLGIIEPTGIISVLVNKYPVLSFYRTRAGFDIVYFFCIYITYIRLYKYATAPCLRYEKNFAIFMLIMIIISIVQISSYYCNNVSLLSSQAKVLDFFKRVNQKAKKGCYAATSPAYIINTVFGMGPPIARLATNFRYIPNLPVQVNGEKEEQYDLLAKIAAHHHFLSNGLYKRYYKSMQLESNIVCDLIVLDELDKNAYDVLGSINFKVVDRIFNYVALKPQSARTSTDA